MQEAAANPSQHNPPHPPTLSLHPPLHPALQTSDFASPHLTLTPTPTSPQARALSFQARERAKERAKARASFPKADAA